MVRFLGDLWNCTVMLVPSSRGSGVTALKLITIHPHIKGDAAIEN
jgi:hypothetical protein